VNTLKKLVFIILVLLGFGLIIESFGGTDATNCWLTYKKVNISGTNGLEITAYFPTNWTSILLQESSDPSQEVAWGAVSAGNYLGQATNSLAGELPAWRRWVRKTDGNIKGPRVYRIKAQKP
jgi:hypothetical protein